MEEKKSQAVIEVTESGPLRITGTFILKDMKTGNETRLSEIWLCRCGKSANKPYCDMSHKVR
jgi:CDGSH-type Zn-finger protein